MNSKTCECGCGEVVKPGNRFINGHFWNGHHRSAETRTKISASKKGENHHMFGKHLSQETCNKISVALIGENSPNYGRRLSKETRTKISAANSGENHPMYGTHRSQETLKKIEGKNSPNWQGGISFEPYCEKFNKRRKEQCRKDFNYICFKCGKTQDEQIEDMKNRNKRPMKLHIHHVYFDKEEGCNGKEMTLIPLCTSCHAWTNSHREESQEFFTKNLTEVAG